LKKRKRNLWGLTWALYQKTTRSVEQKHEVIFSLFLLKCPNFCFESLFVLLAGFLVRQYTSKRKWHFFLGKYSK
jgi:hypothetical protein